MTQSTQNTPANALQPAPERAPAPEAADPRQVHQVQARQDLQARQGRAARQDLQAREDLAAGVEAALEAAQAGETQRCYRSAFSTFQTWCSAQGFDALPCGPEVLAAYLVEREKAGASPATLNLARAAVNDAHRRRGLEAPGVHEGVERTLRGLRRRRPRAPRQAAALTAADLSAVQATARQPRVGRGGKRERTESATRRGAVDIALICVMRDALLRRSEAAALDWEDVRRDASGSGTLTIRHSKTDPEGEGRVQYLSPATMTALDAIRAPQASAGPGSGSIFRLSPQQIDRRIKAAARAAGLGDGYGGHSCRVGMAQDLAAAGVELPALMHAGRWKSARMPARYTEHQAAQRGAVARFYGQ